MATAVVSLLASLPQICSLFLVQETKRHNVKVNWIIWLCSKPSNGFSSHRVKSKSLQWFTKSYTICPLPLWPQINLPRFLHSLYPDKLASFSILTQARNSPASGPEHLQLLLTEYSSPDISMSLPHLLQVSSRIFSWPCYFKLNPASTLTLSAFPALFFSTAVLVIKWPII